MDFQGTDIWTRTDRQKQKERDKVSEKERDRDSEKERETHRLTWSRETETAIGLDTLSTRTPQVWCVLSVYQQGIA